MPHDAFIEVAEHLTQDEVGRREDGGGWAGCEQARLRSATSRAYYAAFRTLKARLIPARVEWRRGFPSQAIHAAIKDALDASLGSSHAVTAGFASLLRRRNAADYDVAGQHRYADVGYDDTMDDLDAADQLMDAIDALTPEQMAGLAGALARLRPRA